VRCPREHGHCDVSAHDAGRDAAPRRSDGATEDGVRAAAASALGRAVRGAQAMGLGEVTLKSIRMVPGAGVVVEILATDSEPSLEESAAPEPLAPSGAPRI
jgi:hypothetical protein